MDGARDPSQPCLSKLKVWLYAKLAWNPDRDVEALLRQFFEGYYGAAAPKAREVFAFNDAESIRLAKPIRAGLDECPDIRLAEAKSDADEQLGYLARVENAAEPPSNGCDRLVLEDSAFTRLAWSNRAKFEDDAAAGDRRAMRCFNKSNQAAEQLKMTDVAFDPGVAYRVRVRARIDRGEARDGVAAFSAYVRGRDGNPFQSEVVRKWARTFPVDEVVEDYAWFDLPEWVPAENDMLQLMRGSCDAWPDNCALVDVPDAAWFDCIEINRADLR